MVPNARARRMAIAYCPNHTQLPDIDLLVLRTLEESSLGFDFVKDSRGVIANKARPLGSHYRKTRMSLNGVQKRLGYVLEGLE